MPDQSNNPFQFWQELKRRKVIRVIPVYAAASFVLLELVDIISEPFGLPDWTLKFVVVLLSIGFIIAIILSWVYDITPEGVKKTKPVTQVRSEEKQTTPRGWKISTYISVLIIIAFVVFYIISNIKQSSDISELEKSIAVRPFKSLSDDPEKQYLADGVMDAILLHLSKIEDLRVMSRTSVEQYRETDKTAIVIGQELNVVYLLEGSFQKYEDQARLIVQLIRTNDDSHIWSNEYDRNWNDILSVQSEVAQTIARELQAVITPKEKQLIEKIPTENLEAYNLYLKGRFFWHRRTENDLKKSINYFNQALELDSTYALAYAGLADAYFIMAWWRWYPNNDGYNKGKEFAIKALSINNNISEAHATLGGIATYHEWKWEDAEKEIKMAISLNPNYATAYQYYSELLDILGKNKEARDQINLSLKLNPHSYVMNVLSTLYYYHNADYEKAIEEEKKVLEIVNSNISMIRILKCYVKLGMNKEAIEHIKNIILIDASSNNHELLDKIYQESGIEGIIYWFINWMLFNESKQYYYIASLYAIIGDSQKAIEYLKKGMEIGDSHMPRMNNNPDFNILKTDPKFIALLKKMRL